MSEPIARIVDKSDWGDGPWQVEPDRVDWVHEGLACLALRGPMGSWCGYVGVPRAHPLHGCHYAEDARVSALEVHGGITYSAECTDDICHVPAPGMPDDVWWLGFDCGHAFDFSPGRAARERSLIEPGLLDPDGQIAKLARLVTEGHYPHEEYRELDYVRTEVNHLADQLAAVGAP
jgi:hypothetical protein